MTASEPAIEVDRLTKRFRRLHGYRDLIAYPWRRSAQTAVDGVTLHVRRGELFGLLGENGAGKTTLIRMLTTTLIPTSGSATVAGHDVVREAARVRRRVGLVAGDERSFYFRLSGRENLAFFAALHRIPPAEARRRMDDLVEVLGLGEYVDRPFQVYSTGIRQRFAIARGLLTDPPVLFLDEPTRALDPIAADEVRRYVMGEVRRTGERTIVMATHALGEAEAMCDRVAILRHGRLHAIGTLAELRSQVGLADVLEVEVSGDVALVMSAVQERTGGRAELDAREGRAQVRVPLDGPASLTDVLAAILATGARIDAALTRRPTLDDIYRAVHAA